MVQLQIDNNEEALLLQTASQLFLESLLQSKAGLECLLEEDTTLATKEELAEEHNNTLDLIETYKKLHFKIVSIELEEVSITETDIEQMEGRINRPRFISDNNKGTGTNQQG